MVIGPLCTRESELARGDCPDCGGDCAPECGMHPMGCLYGGLAEGYWIYDPECPLDHGEDLQRDSTEGNET